MATRTHSLDPSNPRIPKAPTHGWMRAELARNGIELRGIPMTDPALVKALRDLGYDVHESVGAAESKVGDR